MSKKKKVKEATKVEAVEILPQDLPEDPPRIYQCRVCKSQCPETKCPTCGREDCFRVK